MKISRDEVLRVAELANLELSAGEIETYRAQLDEILTYVEKLRELDVANVEPMAQVLLRGTGSAGSSDSTPARHPELRDDSMQVCEVARDVLSQSSDSSAPFFRVPRVIER